MSKHVAKMIISGLLMIVLLTALTGCGKDEKNNSSKPDSVTPTSVTTPDPTPEPTPEPTLEPTLEPTPEPTPEPTSEPVVEALTYTSDFFEEGDLPSYSHFTGTFTDANGNVVMSCLEVLEFYTENGTPTEAAFVGADGTEYVKLSKGDTPYVTGPKNTRVLMYNGQNLYALADTVWEQYKNNGSTEGLQLIDEQLGYYEYTLTPFTVGGITIRGKMSLNFGDNLSMTSDNILYYVQIDAVLEDETGFSYTEELYVHY